MGSSSLNTEAAVAVPDRDRGPREDGGPGLYTAAGKLRPSVPKTDRTKGFQNASDYQRDSWEPNRSIRDDGVYARSRK